MTHAPGVYSPGTADNIPDAHQTHSDIASRGVRHYAKDELIKRHFGIPLNTLIEPCLCIKLL